MLPALNTLAEQKSSPIKNTEAAITHFLEYVATNLSAIIQYKASAIFIQNNIREVFLTDVDFHIYHILYT